METQPKQPDLRHNTFLWLGMLGPAVVWFVYLLTAYLLVHLARRTGNPIPLHIASAVFLTLTILGGVIAAVEWRHSARHEQGFEEITDRPRFMSLIGMFTSLEFSLLIIASWIAMFILSPWQS